jgi:predicted amidohydrolase
MKIKVAVLQYEVPEEIDASFKKLDELTMQASWAGAQLIVAPETSVGMVKEVKESGVDYFPRLSEISKKHEVYLATSFYTKDKEKFYNQGHIISPDGKSVVSHRKLYLAKPEFDDGVVTGDSLEVAETEVGKLGMLICKDGFNKYSHFLYDKFNNLEAEIICIPTWSLSWKEMNTQEYIKSLYVYGSFASHAFILVSGNLNMSTNSFGRSLIVSPVRGVLKEGSTNRKEILYEELDLDEVKKAREFDSWWQPKQKTETNLL